jgi:hypothetical protein
MIKNILLTLMVFGIVGCSTKGMFAFQTNVNDGKIISQRGVGDLLTLYVKLGMINLPSNPE